MATAKADIQNKIRTGKRVSKNKDLESYVEILEENVNAEKDDKKLEQIKLSSEEDLESLLKLAEELKEKASKAEKSFTVLIWQSIQYLAILLLLLFLVMFMISKDLLSVSDSVNFIKFFIGCFLTTGFAVILGQYIIKKEREKSSSDKLALKEVLQLLREVHGTIAEREDWSILKRAEFRIRLSRFDLSEKKESAFSWYM